MGTEKIDSNIADIVICSQAFHWMEPTSTISEMRLEKLNKNLHKLTMNLEKEEDTIIYPQSQHLNNFINSNEFEFCREICFDVEFGYAKERFKKIMDEDIQRYGFERSTIEKDVKTRRIATFLSRYNNAQNLYRTCGEKKIDSRYMLAQIYSAHFNKFDKKVKKNKLVSFIECVKNDEFDKANSCFELSINKSAKLNGFYRDTYVGDAISEVKDLVLPKNQGGSKTQPKELDRDDIVR